MRRNIYFNDNNETLLSKLCEKYDMGFGELISFALVNLENTDPDKFDKEWMDFKTKVLSLQKDNT